MLFGVFVALSLLLILAAAVLAAFFCNHVLIDAMGVWLFTGRPPQIPGAVLFSTQPPLTRMAGVADVGLATTPILVVLRHLRELFRLYARGIVFLQRAGLWLVIYPFAKFAANMLFRLAGGTDKARFHMELIYTRVLGLIVFAIAQVMEFGCGIEQEKDSFV